MSDELSDADVGQTDGLFHDGKPTQLVALYRVLQVLGLRWSNLQERRVVNAVWFDLQSRGLFENWYLFRVHQTSCYSVELYKHLEDMDIGVSLCDEGQLNQLSTIRLRPDIEQQLHEYANQELPTFLTRLDGSSEQKCELWVSVLDRKRTRER